MNGDRPILVTGAAGFIGGAVAAALADGGANVRAGFRHAPLRPALSAGPTVEPIRLDLDDDASTQSSVAGAGAVIHAAYGPDADMAQHCVRLLAAMSAAGVTRLVHFSSIAVYGEREGVVREDDAPVGDAGGYGRAKQASEALIRDWVLAGEDRRALLLRPGVVYGAGARYWIDKMRERIAAGAWGDFGALGDGIAPLIHVDDVAALTLVGLRALDDAPAVHALNLVGPETPSWNHYFAALAAATGHGPLKRLSPAEIKARQAAALPAKLWRRLGLAGFASVALAPGPGELALFGRKALYSTDAASRRLGPARIGLSEGLARSVARSKGSDTIVCANVVLGADAFGAHATPTSPSPLAGEGKDDGAVPDETQSAPSRMSQTPSHPTDA